METWTSEQCSKRFLKTPWNPEWFGSKNNKHVFFLSYFPIYLHLTDRTKIHNYPRTMSYPREKKHPQTTSFPPKLSTIFAPDGYRVESHWIHVLHFFGPIHAFVSVGWNNGYRQAPSTWNDHISQSLEKEKVIFKKMLFGSITRLWIMYLSIFELISKQMLSMLFWKFL